MIVILCAKDRPITIVNCARARAKGGPILRDVMAVCGAGFANALIIIKFIYNVYYVANCNSNLHIYIF